jgi:hypothetical protein
MQEEYLHYLWKTKRLPIAAIQLVSNHSIRILDFGVYNQYENGPDFLFSKIEMDGLCWFGNIEIHLKSSDWYKHKHHEDNLFNSVILHVVYEHDTDVLICNAVLPTIELKNYIDQEHHLKFRSQLSEALICKNSIHSLDPIYLESMKNRMIYERLNDKIQPLTASFYLSNSQRQLFYLLARSFGLKVNNDAFVELSYKLDIHHLLTESEVNRLTILIGASGLDETKRMSIKIQHKKAYLHYRKKNQLIELSPHLWKTKGLRPQSNPLLRIFQFGLIINRLDWNTSFSYLRKEELLEYFNEILEFCPEVFDLAKIEFGFQLKPLSQTIKNLIIINCFVPFIWLKGIETSNSSLNDKAIGILELLAPESNYLLMFWDQIGVKPKTAFDSQALMGLYLKYCSNKKCLSCTVGVKLLR